MGCWLWPIACPSARLNHAANLELSSRVLAVLCCAVLQQVWRRRSERRRRCSNTPTVRALAMRGLDGAATTTPAGVSGTSVALSEPSADFHSPFVTRWCEGHHSATHPSADFANCPARHHSLRDPLSSRQPVDIVMTCPGDSHYIFPSASPAASTPPLRRGSGRSRMEHGGLRRGPLAEGLPWSACGTVAER